MQRQTCLCRHVLKDATEHAMVRHEAAEALGSIASPDCLQLLTDYCKDSDPIVADSCVVSFHCLFLPVLLWLSCMPTPSMHFTNALSVDCIA